MINMHGRIFRQNCNILEKVTLIGNDDVIQTYVVVIGYKPLVIIVAENSDHDEVALTNGCSSCRGRLYSLLQFVITTKVASDWCPFCDRTTILDLLNQSA